MGKTDDFMNSIATTKPVQLQVIMSGGFAPAYQAVVAQFEQSTDVQLMTASGASQGQGAQTIASMLAAGQSADVVILSREGLSELMAAGHVDPDSARDLARVPLGAGVRSDTVLPDISTLASLKQACIDAQVLAVPASTSGIYLREQVFPRLGVSELVTVLVRERGSQSAALVASGQAHMALQPVSELLGVPGLTFVGRLPAQAQLLQVFAAAITRQVKQRHAAQALIDFLVSDAVATAKLRSGMDLIDAV